MTRSIARYLCDSWASCTWSNANVVVESFVSRIPERQTANALEDRWRLIYRSTGIACRTGAWGRGDGVLAHACTHASPAFVPAGRNGSKGASNKTSSGDSVDNARQINHAPGRATHNAIVGLPRRPPQLRTRQRDVVGTCFEDFTLKSHSRLLEKYKLLAKSPKRFNTVLYGSRLTVQHRG